MPDLDTAGLDPAHILGICAPATDGRRGLAIRTNDGLCVCLPSKRAKDSAVAALTRVGYQVVPSPGGQSRDLIVIGWSAERLEARLAAMRSLVHQLAENPMATAEASLGRFRSQPDAPSPRDVFDQAHTELRAWADARSGIHVPHDPAIQPADAGLALRLRATWDLEQAIGNLIGRHLRATAHTLGLFSQLRQRMPDDQAQETALHWVRTGVHLGGSTAQDSSPPTRGPRQRSATDPPPPAIRDGPRPGTVREFPGGITTTTAARLPQPPSLPRRGPVPRPLPRRGL